MCVLLSLLGLLSSTLFSCSLSRCTSASFHLKASTSRIAYGHEIRDDRHVWYLAMAMVRGRRNNALCSGVLIAPRWVLTAQHCEADIRQPVQVGSSYYEIDSIKNHPRYKHSPYYGVHDLALIRLKTKSPMHQSIRISHSKPTNGTMFMLGYGSPYTAYPKWARAFWIPCPPLGLPNEGGRICYASKDYARICNGDSGGPLLAWDPSSGTFRVVAIHSQNWVQNCDQRHKFGQLGMEVAYYADWITQQIEA